MSRNHKAPKGFMRKTIARDLDGKVIKVVKGKRTKTDLLYLAKVCALAGESELAEQYRNQAATFGVARKATPVYRGRGKRDNRKAYHKGTAIAPEKNPTANASDKAYRSVVKGSNGFKRQTPSERLRAVRDQAMRNLDMPILGISGVTLSQKKRDAVKAEMARLDSVHWTPDTKKDYRERVTASRKWLKQG